MDTSYYDECRTLMLRYKSIHIRRFVIVCICMCANFYLHVLMFGFKYAGTSLPEFYASQSETARADRMSALPATVLGILAIAGAFALLFAGYKAKNKTLGKVLVIGSVILLLGVRIAGNRYQNAHMENSGVYVSHLAFGMGLMALLFSAAAIVLALLGEQTRPKVFAGLLCVLLAGVVTDLFDAVIGIGLMVLYAFEIPEIRKMNWIRTQPGYPYFNERFDEQQDHANYEPLHKLDNRSYAEMVDIDDQPPAAPQYHRDKELAHRAEQERARTAQMQYTMKQSDDPSEMPGIEDIFETVEPLPEPELPDVDDIPDPVWSVPDPVSTESDLCSGFPETKWDIPDTNWDIPKL